MWLAGSKKAPLTVYLSLNGFAVIKGQAVVYSKAENGFLTNLNALKHWLTTNHMRCNIEVFLSAGLCRPFIASIPSGLSEEEAALAWQAAAALRTGLSGACQIWKEEMQSGGKQIAAALETSVFSELQSLGKLGRKYARVTSIKPAWSEWLRVVLGRDPSAGCVVLHEPDSATVLAGQDQRFEMATCVLAHVTGASLQASVDRLLLVAETDGARTYQGRLELGGGRTANKSTGALSQLLEEFT